MIRRESDRPEGVGKTPSDGDAASLADDLARVFDTLREVPRASWDVIRVAMVRRRVTIERWCLRLLAGAALAALALGTVVAAIVMTLAGAAGVVASSLEASYWTGALCVGLVALTAIAAATMIATTLFRRRRLRSLAHELTPAEPQA